MKGVKPYGGQVVKHCQMYAEGRKRREPKDVNQVARRHQEKQYVSNKFSKNRKGEDYKKDRGSDLKCP